jgi:Predicted membrane protein (DUF2154).
LIYGRIIQRTLEYKLIDIGIGFVEQKGDDGVRGRWTFGLCVIAVGIVILLRNTHIVDFSLGWFLANFWPLLLIIWGLSYIFERRHPEGKIAGIIIAGLGLIFLGRNLGWFAFDWSMFWKLMGPVFLILIGVGILTRSLFGNRSHFALMHSIEKKGVWRLENHTFGALMGGIELDLTKAEIPEDRTTLQFFAVMGGITITVAPGSAVICEGTSVLGGMEFFGKERGGVVADLYAEQGDVKNSPQVIKIHSFTVMGGIEVKTAAD